MSGVSCHDTQQLRLHSGPLRTATMCSVLAQCLFAASLLLGTAVAAKGPDSSTTAPVDSGATGGKCPNVVVLLADDLGSKDIGCYDLNGKKLWQRELGEAQVGSSLGEGCSPVLHRSKLVIVRDHSHRGSIEVLNAKTGDTLWKKPRDEDDAWATPVVLEHSGRTQIITAASDAVRSYDLDSGDIIWQCSGLTGNVTPCPVVDGDCVICMSGYQGHAAIAIPLAETGDISGSAKLRWSIDRGTPYVSSPLLYNGLLYINQSNQGILRCLDAKTGMAVLGPLRLSGVSSIYSSPVGAAQRVYITGRNGTTLVLKHSAKFEPVATNQLDERIDASPAVAGRNLFLRGEKHLYCIEEGT